MADVRRYVGAALLVCGLALLVTGTGGFDHVANGRTATIDVTGDPDAYLGIVDNSGDAGASIDGGNDTGNLYFLDDNAGAFADSSAFATDVVRVDYDDGTSDTDPGLSATVRSTDAVESLSTSHDYVLEVVCDDGATDQGTGYVVVAITATGDDVVDAERTTNNQIGIDCT